MDGVYLPSRAVSSQSLITEYGKLIRVEPWEYKVVTARLSIGGDLEERLNHLGSDGWELVTANTLPASDSKFIFKRRASLRQNAAHEQE
jgi:hypothetical protein